MLNIQKKANMFHLLQDGIKEICVNLNYSFKYVNDSLLEVLNFDYVSHYCWLSNDTLLIWGSFEGKSSFHFYDIKTKKISSCNNSQVNKLGDGHPTYYKNNSVIVDTYPNRKRLQLLYILDFERWVHTPIVELYSPIKFLNRNRVDLHPRINPSKEILSIDTSYLGKRFNHIISLKHFFDK